MFRILVSLLVFPPIEAAVAMCLWNYLAAPQFGYSMVTWPQAVALFTCIEFVLTSASLSQALRLDPEYRDMPNTEFILWVWVMRVIHIVCGLIVGVFWAVFFTVIQRAGS